MVAAGGMVAGGRSACSPARSGHPSAGIGPVISGLLVSFDYRTPLWITGGLTLLVAGFAIRLKSKFDCSAKVIL